MKRFDEWCFPEHEEHLQGWMSTVQDRQHGRLCYQGKKYRTALAECKHKRVAVDIGGHCALWSFQMVYDFKFIHAFEPMPEHRECYRENMLDFKSKYELHDVALGNVEKDTFIETRTKDSSGDTGISTQGTPVKQKTLDSYGLTVVDFMKIDCEGYEEFVVQGAEQTIKRCQPIIVVEGKPEIKCSELYGSTYDAAPKLLEKWGYETVTVLQGDYIMKYAG